MNNVNIPEDVNLFLNEVFELLALTEPSQTRRVLEGDADADNLKTISVFRITGPAEVTAENTEEWVHERIVKDMRRSGQDWLASIGGGVMPNSSKDLAFAAVGLRDFVVLSATTRKLDQIQKLKFKSAQSMLGTGWSLHPRYSAVSLPLLREQLPILLSGTEHLEEPLGLQIFHAALADRPANS